MDALEALEARTTSLDVRARTPGVQVGMRLRAPTSRFSAAAHLRFAGDALQSENLPAGLAARGFRRNQTDRLLELGAEAGGPLEDGRLWLWGAFARNAPPDTLPALDPKRTHGQGPAPVGHGALTLSSRAAKSAEDRDPDDAAPRLDQSGPTTLPSDARTGRTTLVSRVSADAGLRLRSRVARGERVRHPRRHPARTVRNRTDRRGFCWRQATAAIVPRHHDLVMGADIVTLRHDRSVLAG
jgi:hypothetical protein